MPGVTPTPLGRPLSLPDPFGSECPQYPGDAPPPPPAQPRAGGFPQSHLRTLHDDPYPLCWGVTPKPLGQPLLPVAWGQAMGLPYCCGAVPTLTFGDTPCPPPGVGPTPNPQGSPATRRAVPSSPPNPAPLWHRWGCGVPPPPQSPLLVGFFHEEMGVHCPPNQHCGTGMEGSFVVASCRHQSVIQASLLCTGDRRVRAGN